MLYDPKWEDHTPSHDLLSLERVLAWLEGKSGKYDYTDSRNCLLCQYLRAQGYSNPEVLPDKVLLNAHQSEYYCIPLSPELNWVAGAMSPSKEETFEHARERAKTLLRGEKVGMLRIVAMMGMR